MPHTYGTMQQQLPITQEHLLQTIQHCEGTCEHMISMLVNSEEHYSRRQQIQLLRDCADICALMAKYVARKSPLATALAHYCAYVCELCGNTCAQFPDAHSQHCAKTCLHCARECKAFAG